MSSDQIRQCVEDCCSWEPLQQLSGVQQLVKLTKQSSTSLSDIVDTGVVPKLVEFLGCEEQPELIASAAEVLAQVSGGTSSETQRVVESGAVPRLMSLIGDGRPNVRDAVLVALGNIAGDGPKCRDLVLDNNIITHLLPLCTKYGLEIETQRNCVWLLSNLCRGKPQPQFNLIRPVLPCLADLLCSRDREELDVQVLIDVLWTLSYITDDFSNDQIRAVLDLNILPRIVQCLLHRLPTVQVPALRTIGNIVTGDDSMTQQVIDAGALLPLKQLLISNKKNLQKESLWTISNIAAGNHYQVDALFNMDIFPLVIQTLSSPDESLVKEAVWVVANVLDGGSDEQLKRMVSLGCIPAMCTLLGSEGVNGKSAELCLNGISRILSVGNRETDNIYLGIVEECGGAELLRSAQESVDDDVSQKASQIWRDFFLSRGEQDEEQEAGEAGESGEPQTLNPLMTATPSGPPTDDEHEPAPGEY